MSYTPTTWATGDTITAQKMNKLENGVANAGSALIVTVTVSTDTYIMDKTYAEIYEAFKSGIPCYAKYIGSTDDAIINQYTFLNVLEPIVSVHKYADTYRIYSSGSIQAYAANTTIGVPCTRVYQVTTPTDYPTFFRIIYMNTNYIHISDLIDGL